MANNQPPNRRPLDSMRGSSHIDMADVVNPNNRNLIDRLHDFFNRYTRISQEVSDTVTNQVKTSSKDMKTSVQEDMEDIMATMNQVHKAAKTINQNGDPILPGGKGTPNTKTPEEYKNAWLKALEAIKSWTERNRISFMDVLDPNQKDQTLGKYGKMQFLEVLGGLGHVVTKMAPSIVALGSIAAAIVGVIDKVLDMDKQIVNLSRSFGGAYKASKNYIMGLEEVQDKTHLTEEAIHDLSEAFHEAGFHIMKHQHITNEYLTVMADVQHVFGTATDKMADFTYAMFRAGKSADDVKDVFGGMYSETLAYGLSLKDLNSSLSEGEQFWLNYGGVAGKSLDQMQLQVLQTKGMLRGFNIDIKKSGELMGNMWANPRDLMRQASWMQMRTGKSWQENFMGLAGGSKEALAGQIESIVAEMHSSGFGKNNTPGGLMTQMQTLQRMQSLYGVDRELISQSLNSFKEFQDKNPKGTIKEWVAEAMASGALKPKGDPLQDAINTMHNSIGSTFNHLNNQVDKIFKHIAYFILEVVPPMMAALNNIIDAVNQVASWLARTLGWTYKQVDKSVIKPFGEWLSEQKKSNLGGNISIGDASVLSTKTEIGRALSSTLKIASHAMKSGATTGGHRLGWLSSRYEATGPGVIGDRGHGFGSWQMDDRYNTPLKFLDWIQKYRPLTSGFVTDALNPFRGSVHQGKHGEFGKQWMSLGKSHPKEFEQLQHDFIKAAYFDPMKEKFGKLLDNPIIANVAWSTAVHHGVGGAKQVFAKSGAGADVSPEELIKRVYTNRLARTVGHKDYDSFKNRFANEQKDALAALLKENNELLKEISHHTKEGSAHTSDLKTNIARQARARQSAKDYMLNTNIL